MSQKPTFLALLILAGAGFSQTPAPAALPASELNTVLARMDEGSKRFKSGQADFKSVVYTAVVKDSDEKTGQIFARRKDGSQEVAIRILAPHPMQALLKGSKALIYDPKINQTTEQNIGDKADAQSVMNLASAFGIKGQELLRDYDVTLAGWEMVDNVKTARLEMVPRKASVKNLFTKVVLWIDLERDVALQQQRFESSGDYQLAHYTNIKMPDKISDEFFAIKKGGGRQ
ncbi:MAG TPA: outer membrane lipoprotein-sorting protein [Candidatus Angelobacter sp.]